jgi:hypothetical protein
VGKRQHRGGEGELREGAGRGYGLDHGLCKWAGASAGSLRLQLRPRGNLRPNQRRTVPSRADQYRVAGSADCSIEGQAGWVRNVTNQVQYIDGSPNAVSGLTAADQISTTTPNQLGISGTQVGSYPTTGDGSFPDTDYVCSTACPSNGETGALQNWAVSGIPLPHVNAITYQCGSITIDGH